MLVIPVRSADPLRPTYSGLFAQGAIRCSCSLAVRGTKFVLGWGNEAHPLPSTGFIRRIGYTCHSDHGHAMSCLMQPGMANGVSGRGETNVLETSSNLQHYFNVFRLHDLNT